MLTNVVSKQVERLKALEIGLFRTNSADVEKNDVFVCRKGITVDGHDFAQDAVEKGAVAVIANKPMALSVPVIVTESHYQSLALIKAFYKHPHQKLRHIGVTGTNGKTTVSHCLNQILNLEGLSAYIGTLGAKLADHEIPLSNTTPDGVTLLNIFNQMCNTATEFNVMELSSHALTQDRAGFVPLELGVITNIGEDHLDFHRTRDSYVQAKLQLVDRIQSGGSLIVNLDDPHALAAIERASKGVNIFSFSTQNPLADLIATRIETGPRGMRFSLSNGKECIEVNSPMPFSYNVENALAIASVLSILGWDLVRVAAAIEGLHMPEGRAQFVGLSNGSTGLVDYAHNSHGLNALLQAVREHAQRRLIVVVGVTGDRIQQAGDIGAMCARYADLVIFTSDNPMGVVQSELFRVLRSRIGTTPYFEISDRAEAIKLAKQLSERDDLIVVCGKGNETFQYISDGKAQRHHYVGDLAALKQVEAV